jgi:formyltetrahydrofolate-dependent phosphoribosylglycinamide formyltransferase
VISNRADAGGLAFAREQGIATMCWTTRPSPTGPRSMRRWPTLIDAQDPQGHPALVVLAGFMRVLTPDFVRHYEGRLVNIHPSLLPAFAGLHTHARALAAGCRFAGATVHLVTEVLDEGPILAQAVVPVLPGDTPEPGSAGAHAGTPHLQPRDRRPAAPLRRRRFAAGRMGQSADASQDPARGLFRPGRAGPAL